MDLAVARRGDDEAADAPRLDKRFSSVEVLLGRRQSFGELRVAADLFAPIEPMDAAAGRRLGVPGLDPLHQVAEAQSDRGLLESLVDLVIIEFKAFQVAVSGDQSIA